VRIELIDGERDPSGIEGAGLTFAPKEHFVLAFDGARPVASAGWLAREVRAGDQDVAAACLGGVLVSRSRRGRGLSRVVSMAAMSHAAQAGRTHGVLLCRPAVQPLWAHLGWTEISAQVTYTDPAGERRTWPLVAMTRPLSGGPWPVGPVDLGGLPF
jgi:GNAT superfamily N-acetyltransferase